MQAAVLESKRDDGRPFPKKEVPINPIIPRGELAMLADVN